MQVAVGQAAETVDVTAAAELHQSHLAQLARLEAHGRAGRDVQVHAEGDFPGEIQRLVDLEEVIVAADLHRAVAGVEGAQGSGGAAAAQLNVALRRNDFPRCGQARQRQAAGADRLVHGDQLGAVGKGAFHLQHRQQVGDTGQHVVGAEDGRAEADQLGDATTFARAFEYLVGDQRAGFRKIQAQALGAAFAR